MVLRFVFLAKTLQVTHQCFGDCSASRLSLSRSANPELARVHEKLGGDTARTAESN